MRVGLFTDAFPAFSLDQLLDWLGKGVPGVRDLEIGTVDSGSSLRPPQVSRGALQPRPVGFVRSSSATFASSL